MADQVVSINSKREALHFHPLPTFVDAHNEAIHEMQIFKKALRKLKEGTNLGRYEALQSIRIVILFLREDFTQHMEREEGLLFPTLRSLRRDWADSVEWMEQEHEDLQKKIGNLQRLTRNIEEFHRPMIEKVIKKAEQLEVLMAAHFHREEEMLLTRAMQVLSPKQMKKLKEKIGETELDKEPNEPLSNSRSIA